MGYRDNKAKQASRPVDTVANLQANNTAQSNQVRFQNATGKSVKTGAAQGKAQIGANTRGTGTDKVPTAIALSGKRKKDIKLPANF
jgi:hypothetical protein